MKKKRRKRAKPVKCPDGTPEEKAAWRKARHAEGMKRYRSTPAFKRARNKRERPKRRKAARAKRREEKRAAIEKAGGIWRYSEEERKRKKREAVARAREKRGNPRLGIERPRLFPEQGRMLKFRITPSAEFRRVVIPFCRTHSFSVAGFVRECALLVMGLERNGMLSTRTKRVATYNGARVRVRLSFTRAQLDALKQHAEDLDVGEVDFIETAAIEVASGRRSYK